jgi:FAD/FMN-containing dehydrogenase
MPFPRFLACRWRMAFLALGTAAVLAAGFVVGRAALFLAWVGWHDRARPLDDTRAGVDDASRIGRATPRRVVVAASEEQLRAVVRQERGIALSGARHSMGGQARREGGVVIDTLPWHAMRLDGDVLTVQAGARWSEVIPFLDARGYAVGVMQANNDFTVGGSLSVNCHGWQHDSPPIAGSVLSFRLLTADGRIVPCSRGENRELFSLALGGYGLFGMILDARLRVVPNVSYRVSSTVFPARDYAEVYRRLAERPGVGMAYGRIRVAPDAFLDEATLVCFQEAGPAPVPSLRAAGAQGEGIQSLKRLVFRGGIGSDYGKNLRWEAERLFGESGHAIHTRAQIQDEPSAWFSNRDPQGTEVLHEYFIPPARLAEFLAEAKPVFAHYRPDLLNITVRNVEPDPDTFLCYAREEVFGLVMLFHLPLDGDAAMGDFTRALVDVALRCGGTYYLPYRPHPTREQFLAAYPQAPRFAALKKKYDPQGVFQNEFYANYIAGKYAGE